MTDDPKPFRRLLSCYPWTTLWGTLMLTVIALTLLLDTIREWS